MTYTHINFKTKKALKEALRAGQEVRVFEPGPYPSPTSGRVYLEGPHAPARHTWYASGEVRDGKLIKLTS